MTLVRGDAAQGGAGMVPIVIGGKTIWVQASLAIDASGNAATMGGKQESFYLAEDVDAAGTYPDGAADADTFGQVVYGGDYVWSVVGTIGAGGSVQLKAVVRNADGAVIGLQDLGAAKTAADSDGGTGVGLGSGAEVVVTLTGGNLDGVYVLLSRLP